MQEPCITALIFGTIEIIHDDSLYKIVLIFFVSFDRYAEKEGTKNEGYSRDQYGG